jgi:hypothetical protein
MDREREAVCLAMSISASISVIGSDRRLFRNLAAPAQGRMAFLTRFGGYPAVAGGGPRDDFI